MTLLGQNVNSYGRGLEERTAFPQLLALLNDVPGLERIRFVTSHPRDLSDELIAARPRSSPGLRSAASARPERFGQGPRSP